MATAEKMRAAEKLLSLLSERKKSIIEHVKQQTESYSQHLASKLLIEGINPPSWLRDPSASGSKVLNEEDLISKFLSRYPQPSCSWSVARYPGHINLVTTGDNDKFSDGVLAENPSPNKDLDLENDPAAPGFSGEDHGECALDRVPELDAVLVENPSPNKDLDQKNDPAAPGFSGEDHGECALNMVPELDASATSPEDQTDGRILSIFTVPDQSLARIQRSKSRQKALELRSSAKASAKSSLRHKSSSDVVSSQIRFSLSITNQPGQNDELFQFGEPCIIDSQSCENKNAVEAHCLSRELGVPISVVDSFQLGCSSEDYKGNASCQDARARRKESMPISDTEHADNHVNKSPKSAGPSAVCCQNFRDSGEEDTDICNDEEKNNYTGEITRLEISSRMQSCGCDSTKADSSYDDHQGISITMMDSGYVLSPDCVDGSLMKINLSNVGNEGGGTRESVVEDFGRYRESDAIPSLSSIQCNACIDEISDLEIPSASAKQRRGLESEVALTPSDSFTSADPKQLELKETEEYNMKAFTSESVKKISCSLHDPDVSLDKGIHGGNSQPSSSKQIPGVSDISSKGERAHRDSFEPDVLESPEHQEGGGTRESAIKDFVRYRESDAIPSSSSIQCNACTDEISDLEIPSVSAKQRRGLESEVALTPSDSFASAEPKQLELKETEEYNLKAFTSESVKKISCSLHDPDVSLDKGIRGGNSQPSSSKQIPGMSDISSKGERGHRDSFEPDVLENPDTHIGNFGPVIRNAILNSFKDGSEAEPNSRFSEVQHETHNLLSKFVGITDIQIPPVKLRGLESSPVHCTEQGDCNDEATFKGQLVSSAPESNNSRLSYDHNSAKDPAAKSYCCSSEKAGTNPIAIAINEINQCPAQQSQILSWPEGEVCSKHEDSSHGYNSIGRHSTIRLDGKNSSLERRHARIESWPQVKRRKIEHQQAHGFATSQSFRVTKHHTFQRYPDITYPKTLEIDVETGVVEHVDKSTDDGIRLEMKTNLIEGIPSDILSQHGEVGSCYIKKNEHNYTSPVIDNEQLVETISSLAMKESRNLQRCFIEETRTSPSSCNYLDARMSGDNLSSESLNLSSTLLKEIQQSPKWEDGLLLQPSVLSSSNEDLQLTDVDQSMPVFEGFIVNAQTETDELDIAADGFNLGELELPRTTLERASILAEICRSASLDRPSSHFSSAFKFQETGNLCKSLSDDADLDHMEFGNNYPLNADLGIHFQSHSSSSDDYKDVLDGMPSSVSLAYSGERYGWDLRNQPPSPVGKLWNRLSTHTGSSGKCSTSNPELTCFPIEEDPSSSEENKSMEENAGDTLDETDSSFTKHCDKRQPLTDLTNMGTNPTMSVSAEEETLKADSVDFLRSKFSVTGTQKKALLGPKYQCRKKSEIVEKQASCSSAADGRKHQLSSIGPNAIKRAKESVSNSISKPIVSNKASLKGQDQKLSLRDSRRNNIVSNVSSFIPLIQQKQAAAACKGKRDVKVKALEDAEVAKRLEAERENKRKERKEALKLERAKLEEKNLKHMELEKKKKEYERKKKDADIIAKKRLREDDEKKEKEKKRMRLESRHRQREQEEKKRVERPKRENQRNKVDQMNSKKELNNESKRQQNRETTIGEGVALQKTVTNFTPNEVVVNYEECGTCGLSCDGEAMHAVDKTPRNDNLIVQNNQEQSYDITPYQCSDDEDEEDDDELPTKKYVPSWASKSSIAPFLPLLHEVDSDMIFPRDSFCSMDEVLLPRRLQKKQVAG